MQMIVHNFVTMGSIIILVFRDKTFISKRQMIVEVGSEFALLTISIQLSLFNDMSYSKQTRD